MTRFGLDSVSMVPVAGHHAVGSTVAIRYLSRATSKVVTRAEHEAYKGSGIDLYLVFEDSATNALQGYAQGKADAEWSVNQATDLLGPPRAGWQLPFAVDFDPTGREAETDLYFEGVASVKSKGVTGPYGGYSMVAHSHARGFRGLFQTYAWSSGQFFAPSQVFQYSNAHSVAGVGVDFNHIYPNDKGDFGQWDFTPLPPEHPLHYERFDKTERELGGRRINEYHTVVRYDLLRKRPFLHRKELAVLRQDCKLLAGRIYHLTTFGLDLGEFPMPPAWNVYHRGWRFQQLIHRSQGKKIAP